MEEQPKFVDKRRIKSANDHVDEAGEADLDRAPTYVQQLQRESEENDARLKEYIAAHKAKMGEIDEFRKRLEADAENQAMIKFGEFIKELFPIIDDFDRAIDHAKKVNPDDPLLSGMEMLKSGFMKTLVKNGLEVTDFAGKPFDPELAQAIGVVTVDDESLDNSVVEQVVPGYLFNGRVLRPAMVKVGQIG